MHFSRARRTQKYENNQPCPVRMSLVELPRDAAADLAEPWWPGVLIALLGLAYWSTTGSRAVPGLVVLA